MTIILPCSVPYERGICDVQHGLVDYSDDGDPVETEGDGDAKHGEEVGVVYCSVEGVDAPCWCVCDHVVASATGGVGLFSYESVLFSAYGRII